MEVQILKNIQNQWNSKYRNHAKLSQNIKWLRHRIARTALGFRKTKKRKLTGMKPWIQSPVIREYLVSQNGTKAVHFIL